MCKYRSCFILPVIVQVPVDGSYNSALFRALIVFPPTVTPRRVLWDKKRASAGPKGQFLNALKDEFFWTG
jgi:hypothetical protein